MNTDIASNLQNLKAKITEISTSCGRRADEITLIGISKTKPVELIKEAVEQGQVDIGENKVQELIGKMEELPDERINWHMVGPLQTNKIKYLADRTNWIQSVARIKELNELERRVGNAGRKINVLIQVNISDEEQKSGCRPDELESILNYASELSHVYTKGLMGIATLTEDREQIRSEFALLRDLKEKFANRFDDPVSLEHLSMGMTHDMDIAIEEGATMIRVGTALFGARDCALTNKDDG